jgi:hypothetical protein
VRARVGDAYVRDIGEHDDSNSGDTAPRWSPKLLARRPTAVARGNTWRMAVIGAGSDPERHGGKGGAPRHRKLTLMTMVKGSYERLEGGG